jgi:hypothetical protein
MQTLAKEMCTFPLEKNVNIPQHILCVEYRDYSAFN